MSDIRNQLIKDSYNYVLQSDLSTGVVYRIGGVIPVNPIFQSAITVNSGFTYRNGTEQPNYVLTTDGTGYSFWAPVSGTSPYLPLSGGTVTGNTVFTSGLTANTISAATYQNLPQNLSYYVSGSTQGGSHISGDRWLNTTSGDELVWVNDGDSQQWIQISSIVGGGNSNSSIVIASSNCNIISDDVVYISNSKFGWSYYYWELDVSSYDRSLIFSIIPIPKKLGEGQTISVYGVAYSCQLDSEALRGYIYIVNCNDLDTLSQLYDSGWNEFSVDGNLCFNFEYTLSPGESYTEYVNFISIGFRGKSGGGSTIQISWSIKIN